MHVVSLIDALQLKIHHLLFEKFQKIRFGSFHKETLGSKFHQTLVLFFFIRTHFSCECSRPGNENPNKKCFDFISKEYRKNGIHI